MIIQNKPIKNGYFINRTGLKIEPLIDYSYENITTNNNETVKKYIPIILDKLNKLDKSKIVKKIFNNYNSEKLLLEINNYLDTQTNFVDIIIYNYENKINLDIIKNFYIVNCLKPIIKNSLTI